MGTLMESLRKFGVEAPVLPEFSSEDLPYLIMAALISGDVKTMSGLMVTLALKIEQLEEALWETKFAREDEEKNDS